MFHHGFIVDNHTVWVRGDVSKLEAFASICPVPADQFMVSAFVMNFPGATPLDCKELDKLPRPASGTVKVVRRPMASSHLWHVLICECCDDLRQNNIGSWGGGEMVCAPGAWVRSSPLKEVGGGVGKGAPVTDLLLNPFWGSLSTPFCPVPRDGRCHVATLPTCGLVKGQGLCPHCPNFYHQLQLQI